MIDIMLTTHDNKFDPFTEFDQWMCEDLILGHNTNGMLASYANTSIYLSDKELDREIERAIDEIVHDFPLIFKKVSRTV